MIAAVSGEVGVTFTNIAETSVLVKAGMLAPKGTPQAIVALLNEKLKATMTSRDQSKRFEERGMRAD